MESLTPYLKQMIADSSLPLKSIEKDFAVDSSGFSTSRFVRWFDVKYGGDENWHDWIKLHLMCGTSTHIVTSVEVSRAYQHDSPFFKPLVEQTAQSGFEMKEVAADKAYLSAENLHATLRQGAMPYIPFKARSTGRTGGEVWAKLFHLQFQTRRIPESLSQAFKRRNDIQHDQSEVRRAAAMQD